MRKRLKELYHQDINELRVLLDQKRKELAKLRVDHKLKKIKNVHMMKFIRKEIARILTIISERKNERSEFISRGSEKNEQREFIRERKLSEER